MEKLNVFENNKVKDSVLPSEILIVDHSSDDNITGEVTREYAKTNIIIKYKNEYLSNYDYGIFKPISIKGFKIKKIYSFEDYVSNYYNLDFDYKFDLIDMLCLIAKDIKKLFEYYKINPVFYTENIFDFLTFCKEFRIKSLKIRCNDFLEYGLCCYKIYINYIFDNFYPNIDKNIFLKPFVSLFKAFSDEKILELEHKLEDYELLKEIPSDPINKVTVAYDIMENKICLHTMDYSKGYQTHPSVLNNIEHYYVILGFVSPSKFFKETLEGINFNMNFKSICDCIDEMVRVSNGMDTNLRYLNFTEKEIDLYSFLPNKEKELLKSIIKTRNICIGNKDYFNSNAYEEFIKNLVKFLKMQLDVINKNNKAYATYKYSVLKDSLVSYLNYFINYAIQ